MKYDINTLIKKPLPDYLKTRLKQNKNKFINKNFDALGLKPFKISLPKHSFKKCVNDLVNTSIEYKNDWWSDFAILKSCSLKQNINEIKKEPGMGRFSYEWKEYIFSFKNLLSKFNSKKNLKMVFSTDPWDIATMSMRGIDSCMKWSSKDTAISLLGSMICPNTAIVYITDGKKTKYGENMLFRAVVRIIKNNKQTKLFVEEAYPKHYSPIEDWNLPLKELGNLFKYVLKNKTNNLKQINDVVSNFDKKLYLGFSIPKEKDLSYIENCEIPYIDTDILSYKRMYDAA